AVIFGSSSRGDPAQIEKAEGEKRKAGTNQSRLTSAATKHCKVSIEESSQFASALLLSAGIGNWQIEIVGENADESPYVAMTSKLIEAFPKKGGTFQIEPDASSVSYFWGAGWIMHVLTRLAVNPRRYADWTGSPVIVKHWPDTGWQIDADFPNFLPFPKKISREDQLGDGIMTAIVLAIDRDTTHSLGFTQYYD